MNPMMLSLLQGPNPTFPQVAPQAPPVSPVQNNMQSFMNNPLTSMGMGLLGGNYGRNSNAAFANAMRGGMLGLESARRNQMVQVQYQLAQQKAEREKREREKWQQLQQQQGMGHLPQSAYETLWTAQNKPEEAVQAMVNGQATWVPRSKAYGLPTVPRSPLVSLGDQRSLADSITLETVKADAEYYRGQAEGADKAIQSSRKGLNLMKQGTTGRWEPIKGAAAAWAGIDPSAANTYDMWRDYATTQALDTLQQFKGPTTDFEYGVAKSLAVQQGKSDFANFVALKAQQRAALRSRAKRSAYSEWVGQYRQKFPDFEQWFEEKRNRYPAWDLPEFEKAYNEFRGPSSVEERNQGFLK